VAQLAGRPAAVLADADARSPWYARSVDSTYLTGKRVFVFGDATHVVAAARVAAREMGFTVVGLGTYSREFARDVREAAKLYGVEALITDDYLEVEERIAELQPELVLGTQMERHIAKRLGIPCAVISAPVHVQDFPARYSPQMGFEGANVMFDTWVHPLMMGLEEHLIGMFRGDFEFHEDAAPSHLGGHGAKARAAAEMEAAQVIAAAAAVPCRRPRPPPAPGDGGGGQPRWRQRCRHRPPLPAGPRRPSASCARFRSSCAARPAATPRSSPRSWGFLSSPSRPFTMPKPTSAADSCDGCRARTPP
jgi:hypothetical protein